MNQAYRNRRDAVFTAENDHNPMIQRECPSCHGYGKRDIYSESGGGQEWTLTICAECNGTGVLDGLQPYFDNDNPPMEASLESNGWVKCPNCGIKFATYDKHRWTGLRHMKCGQKITLIDNP